MEKSWRVLLGLLVAINLPLSAFAATSWPKLQKFSETIGVDWQARRIDIDIPFYNDHGIIQYRLICRGGSEEYLDRFSEGPKNINYVGPLMCVLNLGNSETENSLLAEDDSPPWHTRGQFHTNELMGACAT